MFSIITCNYNLGDLLPKTIESVLSQDYQDFELIIIDADSKDNSLDIIKEYSKKDERIKYISEPDKGHFYGINKGLRIAKNKIIGFQHSSDWYEKNIFQVVAKEFKNRKLMILGGNTFRVLKNKKIKYDKYRSLKKNDFYNLSEKTEYFLSIDDVVNFNFPAVQSTFFRKDVFDLYGNFSTNYYVSRCHTNVFMNLFMKTLRDDGKIKAIDIPIGNYLEHDNSYRPSSTRGIKYFLARKKSINKLLSDKSIVKFLKYKVKILNYQPFIYFLDKSIYRRNWKYFIYCNLNLIKGYSFIKLLKINIMLIIKNLAKIIIEKCQN